MTQAPAYNDKYDKYDKYDSPAALTIDATTEIHCALQHRGLSLNDSMKDSVGIGPHNKFEDVGTLVVFAGLESKEASCMRLGGEVDLQSMLIYMYIYIYIIYI